MSNTHLNTDQSKADKLQAKRGETRMFYHGTYENVWEEIQKSGVLWGCPVAWENFEEIEGEGVTGMRRLDIDINKEGYRYTYLSPEKDYAEQYGDVLLEVVYAPKGGGAEDENGEVYDNYGFDPPKGQFCWQFSVFQPIPLKRVRRIN